MPLVNDRLDRIDEKLSILEQIKVNLATFTAISSLAARASNTYCLGGSQISITLQHNEVGTFLIVDEKLSNIDIDDCFTIHDKYTDNLIDSELSFKDYKRIVYNFLPLEDNDLPADDVRRQQGILV